MLDAIPASNELKEKKRLLKKAKKLSKVFQEDFTQMEGEASSSAPRSVSSPSAEAAEGGTSEQLAGRSLPQIQESLGTMTERNMRRSSSVSGHSFFTTDNPSTISSEADSQAAILSTPVAEQLRKGKVSGRQENIPPSKRGASNRRQSLDLGSGGVSGQNLKRSTSLWAHHQRQGVLDDAAGEFQDRYLRNFGTGTMSERQRTLNVKRARKMTQLFGQEPPSELIQIHDERQVDHFRDSTATLSTIMAPAPPLRDRANSVSSTATIANEVEADDELPPTPPPFSTSHAMDDDPKTSQGSFQDRRRRAAKLSRFFGVGFQDISLPPGTAPAIPEAPPLPDTRIEVDVKVSGRRFWSFSDRSKDGDMQEAIQKLRGLRAS
ncbi:hypothetical protein FB451DRAFT_1143440 [Mycena latifolia]|nr:hypothetical protein FB451DRAFT_1143440 [Mycena latifolia]